MRSCGRCGRLSPAGARFCDHCGGELAGGPAAAAPQAPIRPATTGRRKALRRGACGCFLFEVLSFCLLTSLLYFVVGEGNIDLRYITQPGIAGILYLMIPIVILVTGIICILILIFA